LRMQLRMINTVLFHLAGAFLAGVVLGLIVKTPVTPLQLDGGAAVTANPVSLFWLPLCVFALGTSTLGYILVPLFVFLRGYLLTASLSILLRGGMESSAALLAVALPALFPVPAFFLLCEDAVSSSRILCLCSESGLTRRCGYIRPVRLLISVALLLAAAAAQIYLIPQIV